MLTAVVIHVKFQTPQNIQGLSRTGIFVMPVEKTNFQGLELIIFIFTNFQGFQGPVGTLLCALVKRRTCDTRVIIWIRMNGTHQSCKVMIMFH